MKDFLTKHTWVLWASVIVAGLIFFRFYPFFLGKTLFFGDNYSLLVPGKLFAAEWLGKGTIPLWNPYIFGGIPWLSDLSTSVFYPTTLLFLLFPAGIALNISIAAHLFLAWFGMYVLARKMNISSLYSFLAGVLWMFSSHMSGSIHNLATLQSLSWLPLVLYFGVDVTSKIGPVLFSVVVFLQFLGGYPQHVVYSIFAAVFFSLFVQHSPSELITRLWWKKWIQTAVILCALTTVLWLPFIDSFIDSTRILQTPQQAQVGSLQPAMIVRAVIFPVFDSMRAGMKWGPAWSGQPNVFMYISWFGLLVLTLRLFAIKKWKTLEWFFALFIGFSIIFSLGKYLPGYEFIQESIPFFRVGRYPSMVLILTNLISILWFASALKNISLNKRLARIVIMSSIVIFFTGLIGWILSTYQMEFVWQVLNSATQSTLSNSVFHTLEKDQIILRTLTFYLTIVSVMFFGIVFAWQRKKQLVFVALISLEIIFATHTMFLFADNSVYDAPRKSKLVDFLQYNPTYRSLTRNSNTPYTDYGSYWEAVVVREPFSDSFVDEDELDNHTHLKRLKNGLTPDWNMVAGVSMVHGYTALLPIDYAEIWNWSEEPRINFIDSVDVSNPLLNTWSVKYYIVDTWFDITEELPDWPVVFQEGTIVVYENPDALSRFRYADSSQALELATFYENPNKIEFQFENTLNEDFILIADRYDKYWTATVNGQDVPIENYSGMRKVPVQPGENTILLIYKPTLFFAGLAVSAFTVFLLALWVYRLYWYPKASEDFSDPEE